MKRSRPGPPAGPSGEKRSVCDWSAARCRGRPSLLLAAVSVTAVLFLASCGTPPPGSSSSLPEESPVPTGLICEGLDAPEAILEAASSYVEEIRADWSNPDSKYASMAGGAAFDNWRIEGLVRIDHGGALEGYALDVYQLDYRIHAQNPNALLLTGGMSLDQDGWLAPTNPGATYLTFDVSGEQPVYLCSAVIDDCPPGSAPFVQHILSSLPDSVPA